MPDGRSIRTDYRNSGIRQRQKTHCPAGHVYDEANTARKVNRHGNTGRLCKICQRDRMRRKREHPEFRKRGAEKTARWRETHSEKYREGWERAHAEKKQLLDDARADGCVRCGESDIACLDFHHRDAAVKEGHVSLMRRFSLKRLLAEIDKCDVLCANCHRKHHRDEREQLKQEASSHGCVSRADRNHQPHE